MYNDSTCILIFFFIGLNNVAAHTYATTCVQTSDCDANITMCGGTASLTCVNGYCGCSTGDGTGNTYIWRYGRRHR